MSALGSGSASQSPNPCRSVEFDKQERARSKQTSTPDWHIRLSAFGRASFETAKTLLPSKNRSIFGYVTGPIGSRQTRSLSVTRDWKRSRYLLILSQTALTPAALSFVWRVRRFLRFRFQLENRLDEFCPVIPGASYLVADAPGLHLFFGMGLKKIKRQTVLFALIEPPLVVLRFQDDALPVVILRYVELEPDVKHDENINDLSL